MPYCTVIRMWPAPQGMQPMLWLAVHDMDVAEVRRLLENGASVEEEGVYVERNKPFLYDWEMQKSTPLQAACALLAHPCPEIVEMLLQYGASVSAMGDVKNSCLWYAVSSGCVEVVDLVLRYKADIHYIGVSRVTAIEKAVICMRANVSVIRALIEYGANVVDTRFDLVYEIERNSFMARLNTPEVVAVMKNDMTNAITAEKVTRHKCAAFAMTHHKRLGRDSIPNDLDPEVLRMILGRV
jgi:hypothetical protein